MNIKDIVSHIPSLQSIDNNINNDNDNLFYAQLGKYKLPNNLIKIERKTNLQSLYLAKQIYHTNFTQLLKQLTPHETSYYETNNDNNNIDYNELTTQTIINKLQNTLSQEDITMFFKFYIQYQFNQLNEHKTSMNTYCSIYSKFKNKFVDSNLTINELLTLMFSDSLTSEQTLLTNEEQTLLTNIINKYVVTISNDDLHFQVNIPKPFYIRYSARPDLFITSIHTIINFELLINSNKHLLNYYLIHLLLCSSLLYVAQNKSIYNDLRIFDIITCTEYTYTINENILLNFIRILYQYHYEDNFIIRDDHKFSLYFLPLWMYETPDAQIHYYNLFTPTTNNHNQSQQNVFENLTDEQLLTIPYYMLTQQLIERKKTILTNMLSQFTITSKEFTENFYENTLSLKHISSSLLYDFHITTFIDLHDYEFSITNYKSTIDLRNILQTYSKTKTHANVEIYELANYIILYRISCMLKLSLPTKLKTSIAKKYKLKFNTRTNNNLTLSQLLNTYNSSITISSDLSYEGIDEWIIELNKTISTLNSTFEFRKSLLHVIDGVTIYGSYVNIVINLSNNHGILIEIKSCDDIKMKNTYYACFVKLLVASATLYISTNIYYNDLRIFNITNNTEYRFVVSETLINNISRILNNLFSSINQNEN